VKKPAIAEFQKMIWSFYKEQGRHDLPWRQTTDPYKILVSEVMLQQTQVDRVVPKYKAFLQQFPALKALAKAPLNEVLLAWSGLGYNRRALYLQKTAQTLTEGYKGRFPKDAETLETLPGIGPYTARAVATFSQDVPYIFIETNIRRVFIHEFFPDNKEVSDKDIIPLIEKSLLKNKSPREWYWALMDYGSHIKSTVKNPNQRSVHYVKQSKFKGSVRELRGEFLRVCSEGKISKQKLFILYKNDDRIRAEKALSGLIKDGILDLDSSGYVKIVSH
jgi:A/G-specific adenine glycosylase